MAISVAVAIVIGLVSSFIQSLGGVERKTESSSPGLTIQRKSHVQEDLLPVETRRRPIRRPLWIVGFVIYITSNVFSSVFQLNALPIVILAPLGAVSLIFNALLARLVLGDHFGTQSIVGTALVALGAILIAVFGVVQDEEHGLDELLRLWKRTPFVAFFTILCVAVAIALAFSRLSMIALEESPVSPPPSNYASPRSPAPIPFRPTDRRWSAQATASAKASLATVTSKTAAELPADLDAQQRTLTLVGLVYAAASGTLAGMTLVIAKAAVELLVKTLHYFRTGEGVNEFARAQTWFLVIALAIGAVLQLVYLNYSLTFASPALICPLAFCFFNLSSIFDGLMFYDQIGRLRPYQLALVSLGVSVLLLGVWVVSMINSTGEGGVDMGTWVEEDHEDELEAAEGATLLGGDQSAEPESVHEPPTFGRVGWVGSPTLSSPPGSPMSPTGRRRRSRYGSTHLDHAHHAALPGFSIGIGAASPGFALRPESSVAGAHSSRDPRRGQSLSEGHAPAGLLGSGILSPVPTGDTREESALTGDDEGRRDERRHSGWLRSLFGDRSGQIRLPEDDEQGQ